MKARTQDFTILDSLKGVLKPGVPTLLLGPPSSGRSSFLKVLAGRYKDGANLQASTAKRKRPVQEQHTPRLPLGVAFGGASAALLQPLMAAGKGAAGVTHADAAFGSAQRPCTGTCAYRQHGSTTELPRCFACGSFKPATQAGACSAPPACAPRAGRCAQVSGDLRYNGHTQDEFVVERTAAFVQQVDNHVPTLSVRETLEFAYMCETGYGAESERGQCTCAQPLLPMRACMRAGMERPGSVLHGAAQQSCAAAGGRTGRVHSLHASLVGHATVLASRVVRKRRRHTLCVSFPSSLSYPAAPTLQASARSPRSRRPCTSTWSRRASRHWTRWVEPGGAGVRMCMHACMHHALGQPSSFRQATRRL